MSQVSNPLEAQNLPILLTPSMNPWRNPNNLINNFNINPVVKPLPLSSSAADSPKRYSTAHTPKKKILHNPSLSGKKYKASSQVVEDFDTRLGKFLAMLLRHKAAEYGLKIDNEGYVLLDDLVKIHLTKSLKNIIDLRSVNGQSSLYWKNLLVLNVLNYLRNEKGKNTIIYIFVRPLDIL
jgi:hypothetical protein